VSSIKNYKTDDESSDAELLGTSAEESEESEVFVGSPHYLTDKKEVVPVAETVKNDNVSEGSVVADVLGMPTQLWKKQAKPLFQKQLKSLKKF